MSLGKDPSAEGVPAWSGEFWEDEEGNFGYMSIHFADTRTHRAPESWRFVRAYASFEEEAQVFVYRKVCADCVCSLHLLDSA